MSDLLHSVTATPWIYLLVLAIAMVDGFFPVVPAESLVITAAVFSSATGDPDLLPLALAAAAGAFAGDHVSYGIGRLASRRVHAAVPSSSRRAAAIHRARRFLDVRGGTAIVVARYVPGARTAVTVTSGTVGFPVRRFTLAVAVAAVTWASYSVLIGYVGGAAFEHQPLKGMALALGMAVGITAVVEAGRYHLSRRRRSAAAAHHRHERSVASS